MLRGVAVAGWQSRRVEGQGSGSRQVPYTWRPPRKGTLDPGSDLRAEEKLLGERLPRQWTQEAGPMGNQRWDKVDERDILSGRIHAERVRKPQWGPSKSTPTPVFSRVMTLHCASQCKLNEGPVYPQASPPSL